MAQFERSSENASGPGMAFPGMAFPGFGAAAVQGFANAFMHGNMEFVSLASRRVRAQMEFPKQAMNCRTAADFGQMGAQFWHDAFHDYTHCSQRLMALWIQNMTSIGQGDIARQTAEAAGRFAAPMTAAAEDAVTRMSERPAEPWAWWRTDPPGASAPSNGNGHPGSESRATRASY